MNYITGEKSRC